VVCGRGMRQGGCLRRVRHSSHMLLHAEYTAVEGCTRGQLQRSALGRQWCRRGAAGRQSSIKPCRRVGLTLVAHALVEHAPNA